MPELTLVKPAAWAGAETAPADNRTAPNVAKNAGLVLIGLKKFMIDAD
jgi:hypothetical protein